MLITVALAGLPAPRVAGAQQSTVAINVIDHGGKLLPFEQFKAESNEHCAPSGSPLVHLHAINGPAVAIDLSEVPDPAPQGCGFGSLQGGGGAQAATLRLANVTPAQVAAWSKKTNIEILSVSASIPPDAPGQPPTLRATLLRWLPVAGLVALALAVVGGVLVVWRARRTAAEAARYRLAPRPIWDDPDDDGLLRERLARGHADLIDAEEVPAPVMQRDESDTETRSSEEPVEAVEPAPDRIDER